LTCRVENYADQTLSLTLKIEPIQQHLSGKGYLTGVALIAGNEQYATDADDPSVHD
jgi:hypothetical protein